VIWIATALGLVGGVALALEVGRHVLPRMVAGSPFMVRLAIGGVVAALLPALLLSLVVGATLGGAWGPAGVAIGIALVFAAVLLGGALAGVLLAKAILRYRQRQW
jgi:hypothetical protein